MMPIRQSISNTSGFAPSNKKITTSKPTVTPTSTNTSGNKALFNATPTKPTNTPPPTPVLPPEQAMTPEPDMSQAPAQTFKRPDFIQSSPQPAQAPSFVSTGAASIPSQSLKSTELSDQAYEDFSSKINKTYDRDHSRLSQAMINKGISDSSEAYDRGFDDLTENRDDALSGALFQAKQLGLNAQNQFAQQNIANQGLKMQENNLKNSLAASLWQFGQGMGEQQRQYDNNFNMNSYQNDFNNFATMDGINRAYNDQSYRDAVFNASRDDTQYNRLVSALMGQMPQGGAQPIDVMGAYNNQANTAMNQYNAANQQAMNNQAGFNNLLATGAKLAFL